MSSYPSHSGHRRSRRFGWLFFVSISAFGLLWFPLLFLVMSSFQGGAASGEESLWTLRWYVQVFQNETILKSLTTSLYVGFFCTLIGVLIGTPLALVMDRCEFPLKKSLNALIHLPLIMPEIVMALSLLVWFVVLKITLGMASIVLAHVTFTVSYIILTVRTRLSGFDRSLEEAAADLGATGWETFWRVTFPLIWPGILSGALMAFTLSFDDFLITFFTAGVGYDTLPVKIYAMIKYGLSPEISALSTLVLMSTLVLVLVFYRSKPPQGNA